MQKKFKYLITSGCSFTEGHMLGARGSWATYLSKYLGLELINLAKGGNGNELITQNTINYATENKDIADKSLFVIQLSECLRFLVVYDNFFNKKMGENAFVWHITPHQFLDFRKNNVEINSNGFSDWDLNFQINNYLYENRWQIAPLFSNMTYALWRTHNNIINFVNFCKANNYEYIIFDGINNHIPEKDEDGNYYLLSSANEPKYKIDVFPDNENFNKKNINFGVSEKILEILKSNPRYINNDTMTYQINLNPEYSKGNGGHPNEILSKLYAKKLKKILEDLNILEKKDNLLI